MGGDVSPIQAKHEEVLSCLDIYTEALRADEYEKAADASAELVEMDCSMCSRFGRHLTTLVVARQTAARGEPMEPLKSTAINEAEYIKTEIVEPAAGL